MSDESVDDEPWADSSETPSGNGGEVVVIEAVPTDRWDESQTRSNVPPQIELDTEIHSRVLDAFDGAEPHTTDEISRHFDLSHRRALDVLESLHELGHLDRKRVRNGSVVWWRMKS